MIDPLITSLKEEIIDDGMKSLQEKERGPQLHGGLKGFQLCRDIDLPEDFQTILQFRRAEEEKMQMEGANPDTYWKYRYATLQIEHVYERLRLLWPRNGKEFFDAGAVEEMTSRLVRRGFPPPRI